MFRLIITTVVLLSAVTASADCGGDAPKVKTGDEFKIEPKVLAVDCLVDDASPGVLLCNVTVIVIGAGPEVQQQELVLEVESGPFAGASEVPFGKLGDHPFAKRQVKLVASPAWDDPADGSRIPRIVSFKVKGNSDQFFRNVTVWPGMWRRFVQNKAKPDPKQPAHNILFVGPHGAGVSSLVNSLVYATYQFPVRKYSDWMKVEEAKAASGRLHKAVMVIDPENPTGKTFRERVLNLNLIDVPGFPTGVGREADDEAIENIFEGRFPNRYETSSVLPSTFEPAAGKPDLVVVVCPHESISAFSDPEDKAALRRIIKRCKDSAIPVIAVHSKLDKVDTLTLSNVFADRDTTRTAISELRAASGVDRVVPFVTWHKNHDPNSNFIRAAFNVLLVISSTLAPRQKDNVCAESGCTAAQLS